MSANLYAQFRDRFPLDLSHPFLRHRDGSALSYGDVNTRSGQLATMLSALAVGKGDRVAVQVEKSSAAVLLYLACLRAGAVYLPLNTAYTGQELDYFLEDATPHAVVCNPSCAADMQARANRFDIDHVLTLDDQGGGSVTDQLADYDNANPVVACVESDVAAILYSSGTTGRPKGAMLSHGALAANAIALKKVWGFNPNDVLLHALPIFHTHGLFVAINTVLMNGTEMVFHTRFDEQTVIEDLGKATVFMGVHTYYTRLLSCPDLSPDICRHMRLFISGSAPLLEDTYTAFEHRTGHTIVERYGMTEAGIITSADPDQPRKAGTVGWPLDGVSLRVTDESDTAMIPGEIGDVQIKSAGLFTGYWNKPDKTKEDFTADGFFRTGDIGRLEQNGQLTLVGRAKDMFISGGFNIYPKEIEQVLDGLTEVGESAVVGLHHPDFSEAGLAIVVCSRDHDIESDTIRAALKESLANYKVPKLVVQADALPRNAMGKVQKTELQQQYRREWEEEIGSSEDH